ncbi:acyl-CoA dehydrogenase family protein [Nocardia sp. NPDC059240]|uniref:acyl-CoA dehydrogenase family protein n=1 Tax=Nocardia sp. NPDC059240 TaxID=3346786 RepID=UPI00369C9ED0
MNQSDRDILAAETDYRLSEFIRTRINPGTVERDTDAIPLDPSLLHEAARYGLFRHALNDEATRRYFDPLRWGLVLEELGYLCDDLAFPLLAYLCAGMGRRLHGTPAVEQLALTCQDRPLIGFAFTENRDALSMRGRLTRCGRTVRVATSKTIVAGALVLDGFVTYVPDEKGYVTAVLLHRSDPGVTIAPLQVTGFRAAGFGTLTALDTVVPIDRIVSNDGLAHAQQVLNGEAPFFVAGPLGRMRAIVEACARHVMTTERHGTALAEYPTVQGVLGQMCALLETSRATVHLALENYPADADAVWTTSLWMAKYTVAEAAPRLALLAQRLVGTNGFLHSDMYARHLRDFSGLLAGGNPQEKVQIDLGIDLLHRMRSSAHPDRNSR